MCLLPASCAPPWPAVCGVLEHRNHASSNANSVTRGKQRAEQDVYLDTCALADLRALPRAVAAAGLLGDGTGTGKGAALTGLYAVEQLLPT